jgi:predicted nucleic acid-binding protein
MDPAREVEADMVMLDTQLTSATLRDGGDKLDFSVSSTTLQEIFGMQCGENAENRFYLPLIQNGYHLWMHVNMAREKRGMRRRSKRKPRTDRLVIDFARDHPTVVEYSHIATCRLLQFSAKQPELGSKIFTTYARDALSRAAFSHASRHFKALADSQVRYLALTLETVRMALPLLSEFEARFSLKDNFRNSWNDMLILATAIRANEALITRDRVLAEFAADVIQAEVADHADASFQVDFNTESVMRRSNLESRGYINLGWRAHDR